MTTYDDYGLQRIEATDPLSTMPGERWFDYVNDLAEQVRDALAAAAGPAIIRRSSALFTPTTGSLQTVTFGTTDFDIGDMAAGTGSQIVIGSNGIYRVLGRMWSTTMTGFLSEYRNTVGTAIIASTTTQREIQVEDVLELTAGDALELKFNLSASAANTIAALTVERIAST